MSKKSGAVQWTQACTSWPSSTGSASTRPKRTSTTRAFSPRPWRRSGGADTSAGSRAGSSWPGCRGRRALDQFDFDFQPSIDRKQVRELAGLSFVERAENVVLLGPPGVGKTHLAIALGVKAVEAGHSVLFLTLESSRWGASSGPATRTGSSRILQQLAYPRVLILDELGYLPLTREEASLFFRLLVRRYERASLIVTSNKSFVDWGEVFNDQILATGHPRPAAPSRDHGEHQGRQLPAAREEEGRACSGGNPSRPAELEEEEVGAEA